MREHMGLFRGKRIDNGEWVEGFYVNLGGKYHYILDGQLDITRGYPDLTKHPVDPNTIGECTGLKDKNGKLIFEHQTIKYEGELYKVRMWCGMWCMFDKWEHYCELYKYAESSEIIGNIHDYPELLKGGEGE